MWRLKPRLWPLYARYLWLRATRWRIGWRGMVYVGRGVRLRAGRHRGRLLLGSDVRIGAGAAIRSHEGSVAIGDGCVFGNGLTINSYLDVSIGDKTLIADDVYIIDFDHQIADPDAAIMDQGIIKSRVRIGAGCWLGTKVVVTRGVRIGDGAVVGAGAVVTRDVPAGAIAAGVPARVIGHRPGFGDEPDS